MRRRQVKQNARSSTSTPRSDASVRTAVRVAVCQSKMLPPTSNVRTLMSSSMASSCAVTR